MQQFLKHYRVKIRVLSPIHIGSGEKIKKKEYIYMPWNHRVIIPNVEKCTKMSVHVDGRKNLLLF